MHGSECELSCEHPNCSSRKKNSCIIEACEHMRCSFNSKVKIMRENSYKRVIQSHVMGLGVCKEEQMAYYRDVHRLMAMGGIIDPHTLLEDRKKPFKNSPWGEFKNYEYRDGKRVHVDSYILNEQGVAKVNEILTKYVTDTSLTEGKIASAAPFVKEMRGQIDGEFLTAWLETKGVKMRGNKEQTGQVFILGNRTRTYYQKENLLVWSEGYGKDAPLKTEIPFWFIRNQETTPESSAQEKARVSMKIYADYWNLKFGNGWDSGASEG